MGHFKKDELLFVKLLLISLSTAVILAVSVQLLANFAVNTYISSKDLSLTIPPHEVADVFE